jgi:putative endonuclease
MFSQNRILGQNGEDRAAYFLEQRKYKIIKRNYRTQLGEIDIIAWDKDTLCFIEVKTRRSLAQGLPKEAVSLRKQHQITKAALCFIKDQRIFDKKMRFDVVTIDNTLPDMKQIEIIPNAFEVPSY